MTPQQQLRFWRKSLHVTQKEMAYRLKISVQRYNRIETGSSVQVAKLIDACGALGLKVALVPE
jgi:transcriptional regulator with XRE-family HTH domain